MSNGDPEELFKSLKKEKCFWLKFLRILNNINLKNMAYLHKSYVWSEPRKIPWILYESLGNTILTCVLYFYKMLQ